MEMGRLEEADAYRCENRVSGEERPVYHVTPPVGWMNDPNGFSVYKGKIHLFYQYHPYSDKWGPMHWGHVVSTDFINWEEMPVALAPDTDYDFGGCFSGSAIETEEGHVLVYTGVKEFDREDGSRGMLQNQCIAIGDGEHYRKLSCNPVIPGRLLPDQFNREEFRDPKIWREDGVYYLVAGSKRGKNGQVVMFQSEDLQNWEYVSVLADNSGSLGGMWECPDSSNLAGEYI
ncbi:MAG: glycoside hydrolase family 32 protein, partial [Lachnospiraceae bacterium]|nr:glycoside hydrolase family 32 protein [Lachnospiraceae bacterium]